MKLPQLATDELLASLRTTREGLSSSEVDRRQTEFGPNEIAPVQQLSFVLRFLSEFTHFFAVILWVAAAMAFWAESQDPGQGMFLLGAAIVGVIIVNGSFSFWQVYRAERALAALSRLLPHRVHVWRDGEIRDVNSVELVPGDIISLSGGNVVPADSVLIEAFSVLVNNSTVTGESVAASRSTKPSVSDDPLHCDNVLLAGSTIVSGTGKAVVYATGMHTEFGKIARLSQEESAATFPLHNEIRHLSRVVVILATSLGIAFFLLGLMIPLSFWQNFIFAIGIIVANVPEGLLPTVTLALAMGAQRMARRNVLIRHLPAVETLGSATVICTDKTGTLTMNQMSATKVVIDFAVFDTGPTNTGRSNSQAIAATQGFRWFADTLANCHNLQAGDRDPTEVALVEFATRHGGTVSRERINEIPFDSDRRRHSTLHKLDGELTLYCKGALQAVAQVSESVWTADGVKPLTQHDRQRLAELETRLADDGLRVLAVALRFVAADYQVEHLEEDLLLLGLIGLSDPPRPEVPDAIRKCREAGIRVIMVTGDHPRTALGVARQIGLVTSEHARVITGDELRRFSDNQLQLALDQRELVFARVAADQKMRIVTRLQKKGEVVAVTGDGVNDAPALKKADIGIAMGMNGADVARETADMILADDNFASIVAAIEEGRAVYDNIRKFLTYILTSNVPEIVPYLAFVLLRIPLPLTILQILSVDLGTDMVPALALGAEPPSHDVMQRPPRQRGERLVNTALIVRAYLFLGIFESMAAMAAYAFVMWRGGWRWGEVIARGSPMELVYQQATTACLAAIIVMQIVNVFLCRSDTKSLFTSGAWPSRLIALGLAVELAMIAIISYTPVGQTLFQSQPLAAVVWIFILPFGFAFFAAEEVRKWLARYYNAPRH